MAGFVKDNDTVILIKFDDYNNPWKDECNHIFTIYKGTPKLDSNMKKFGNYSVYFNNYELNWLQMSSTTSITELNGHEPWTIEAFVYLVQNNWGGPGSDGNPVWTFFDTRTGTAPGDGYRTQFSVTAPYGYPRFYAQASSGKTIGSKVNTVGRWVHHAVVWNPSSSSTNNMKGTLLSFVDGVYESSNDSFNVANSVRKIARLGVNISKTYTSLSSSGQFTGWIDNLRVSKIARYKAKNFDPDAYVEQDLDIGDPMTCFLKFDNINNEWYDSYENTTWVGCNDPELKQDDSGGYMFYSRGENQYIYTEDFVIGGQDFTIDGWLYIDPSTEDNAVIFDMFNSYQSNISLRKVNGNCLWFNPANGFDSWIVMIDYVGQLLHFAMVYKHDEKKVNCYVNGTRIYQYSDGNIIKKKYKYLTLGYPIYDNNGNIGGSKIPKFVGMIDDFRISDYALWDDEFTISRNENTRVNSNSDLERYVYNDQYLRDKMRRAYEYR